MTRVFDSPINASDQSFSRVLNAGLPVLAIFWNGQSLAPDIEDKLKALARDEAGRLLVVKVSVKDTPQTTKQHNVKQTPLLIGFRDGAEVTRAPALAASAVKAHAQFTMGQGPAPAQQERPAPRIDAEPTARAGSSPVHVTDASFARDVLQSPLPVLVDFWAPWCGPCHMIAPTLEKLAAEYAGRLRVAKVNIDENPRYANKYGVQSIPTLLMFKNARAVDRVVGAQPEPSLRMAIDRLLTG